MKVLLIVDVQNDFCPGGALPVNGGHEVVPIINSLMEKFDLVIATQDWHPSGHGSFASTHGKKVGEIADLAGLPQIMWPDHCVRGTKGADFVDTLNIKKIERIFQKGTDKDIDSYSGFFDNGRKKATGLADYLEKKGVTDIYVVGLAIDYCVKFTALDAVGLGFKTHLIVEGCRGVNLNAGDVEKAIEDMEKAGVKIIKEVRNV